MRINRFIATSGAASRRGAEDMVTAGRVKVNGKVVTNLATEINEDNDTVTLDGIRIEPVTRKIYVMFNKPKGCVCTMKDEKGRKTVMDYLTDFSDKKIFPVGRLDYDSEGLLLLTNDGDFGNRLTQPSEEIPKTYIVKVDGSLEKSELDILRKGVIVDGLKFKGCKVKVLSEEKTEESTVTRLEITLYEGKNRQIRRMFDSIGKQVIFLRRSAIGGLKMGGLSRGGYRYLTQKELDLIDKY